MAEGFRLGLHVAGFVLGVCVVLGPLMVAAVVAYGYRHPLRRNLLRRQARRASKRLHAQQTRGTSTKERIVA